MFPLAVSRSCHGSPERGCESITRKGNPAATTLSCGGRECKIKFLSLGNLPLKYILSGDTILGDRELTYISLATLQTRQDSINGKQNLSTANPSSKASEKSRF